MRECGFETIKELEQLLRIFNHCSDRLKSEDVYHRQLDLALKIGKIMSTKKLQYFKVTFIFESVLIASKSINVRTSELVLWIYCCQHSM